MTAESDRIEQLAEARISDSRLIPAAFTNWYETGELPTEHQWLADAAAASGLEAGHIAREPETAQTVLFAGRDRLLDTTDMSAEEEIEVVRMLYWTLANGVDEHGNRYMSRWLRSDEVYERPYQRGGRVIDEESVGQPPQRSDTVGIRTYSWLALGRNLGFIDSDLEREWFVSYAAEGLHGDMPLRGITEVVDDEKVMGRSMGHLHEGPTPRGSHTRQEPTTHFNAWIKDGVEMHKPKPFVPLRERTNQTETITPPPKRRKLLSRNR